MFTYERSYSKFLTFENLTATKFADEIGVQRSSISHILSGRNNPSYEFIQKILLRYKNLSAEWLITGSGNMLKKPEQRDLFSQSFITPVNEPPIIETKPIIESKVTTDDQEGLISDQSEKDVKITSSRKVNKIIIFYSDKTFEEFLQA